MLNKVEYVYYRFFYSKLKFELDLSHELYLICDGESLENFAKVYRDILNGKSKKGSIPELWDGETARRIVGILKQK